MNTYKRHFGAIVTLVALLLAGCGGGSSSGGGSNPPPPGGGPIGGITRTGAAVAIGPFTGIGSVIVNGVAYKTDDSTSITDDDVEILESELKVGDMLLVQGTISDDNATASATSVDVLDTVEGPVTSVNAVDGNIVVLGQIVQIGPETSVDDNCPATLDGLLDNPPVAGVEVSGPSTQNAAGDIVIAATRLECKLLLAEFEINGIVSGHDGTGKTFMINGLEVNYGSANLFDFSTGAPSDGDPVEATGTLFDDSVTPPVFTVSNVEYKGNRFAENEGDHFEVEGFITEFVSAENFKVGGLSVTTTPGTTVFEGGDATNLNNNVKVEVEGEINSAGVLVATKIEIKQATAVRVTGRVDSTAGDTLMILGITITTDTVKTRFEDKLSDVDPFRISDILTDDYVEVRGQEFPVGEIFAIIVERDDARTETELRGFVEIGGNNRPNLSVLGVTIQTSGATVFRDTNGVEFATEDAFWAALGEGSLISTKGLETGAQILSAEEVELE